MKKLVDITNLKSNTLSMQFGLLLVALVGLLFLILAIIWPLFFVWALNTLFGLSIQYTFWTWLASWILILTFQGAISVKNEKLLKIKRKQADK
jgi:hypothetical protein